MELQVIPLANMWPDPNNPRKDFGDLDALADTFEMNVVRPFEPVNPPTVVPDGVSARGQMYRIVDGERRWRAMVARAAVESCAAIVCSMDEANAMAAMVATDDKAQLTDAELSRGVQQMLAVGVAPEEVDKAARLKRGTARRVAKVAREGTEQLSIGHLLAAEEFDDPDDRRRVLDAPEDDSSRGYRSVAREIEEARKRAAKVAELRAACEAAGVPLAATCGEANEGGRSYRSCARAGNVAEVFAEQAAGTVGWICEDSWGGPEVRFYGPSPEKNPEDARVQKLMKDADAARSAWFYSQLVDRENFCLDMLPIIEAYRAACGESPEPYDYSVTSWMKRHGLADKIVETGHVVKAFVRMGYDPLHVGYTDGEPRPSGYAAEWTSLGCAMRSLGYRPSPDEIELEGMVAEAIEKFSKKEEEEDE
ncbi:ParB/RepB/Spo0J family partition protein [Adlercreutzia caecimuris]|uniref:ParB/RepB/Spo0J family partition protein n=1 Tax=Adlercreutzia caecimuris TaxID=671266 RepID=UPI001C3EB3E6|nr:ParB/RepB/Spo0J family partition protein [Adlercreutzia caecimuris]